MKLKFSGFTLVEMAIVLAIIALLLGSGVTLLSVQQDQRRIEDTNALLSSANETLIGFALSHTANDGKPYLPCPDVMNIPGMTVSGTNLKNDGVEDRIVSGVNAGACDNQEGNLPWVTLGLTPQTDAWSNRLRYRVTDTGVNHFSNKATGMQLTFVGDINVNDGAGNAVVTLVPAVILSHGKNGLGAINTTCNSAACYQLPPAANIDERANTDSTVNFVSHSIAAAKDNPTNGEFDDQVIWLSSNILFNRMVQAGMLP